MIAPRKSDQVLEFMSFVHLNAWFGQSQIALLDNLSQIMGRNIGA